MLGRIMLLLIGGMLLAGCETAPKPAVALTGNPAGQASQSARLKVGEQLEVELAGNPTTGYNWLLTDFHEGPLKLEKDDYIPENRFLTGAPGKFRWVFRALAPGETKLEFRYFRPWETFNPQQDARCEYRIAVE
ncbi:hypothetical protein SDC9_120217 [bioreactor metagenome]|uniref:Proteinase inhibitor I42 chagasin domain-containing protein n=1 Tax=bioreactor metagenome TaxID=1076179 RepID=A0A645C7Y3_9ZZZZ